MRRIFDCFGKRVFWFALPRPGGAFAQRRENRQRPLLEDGDRVQRIRELLALREKNYAQAHVA